MLERSDGWQTRHAPVAVPIAIAIVKKFIDEDAVGLVVQVAYWGFFSVFSLLLAFVSILGFAFHSDPSFQKQVLDSTLRMMPVIGPQISGHIGSLTGNTLASLSEWQRRHGPDSASRWRSAAGSITCGLCHNRIDTIRQIQAAGTARPRLARNHHGRRDRECRARDHRRDDTGDPKCRAGAPVARGEQ